MKLKEIFIKPVDRTIEGVIKADDETSLRNEVEEYVLTKEIEKRLEEFLDAYNNYEGANGVWISGFFGSGKSHLLKMLALLLENRAIDGVKVLDLLVQKCKENQILQGDLKKAVGIPSKSILFNIDQKATIISKKDISALLAVFVKVFDEMCGYYGNQGYIAKFERDLDKQGLYNGFKKAYQDLAGKTWEVNREIAVLEAHNIAEAYARAVGADKSFASGILEKYRSEYKVSIEDFAEQVKEYIDRQEPKFRLNFFVDEVGQYIADNTKLMTNLQTIAETLATKCNGRAWVIVTAQEDMNNVVGEMTKQQGNDFSKIQARFKNRMKLTSQDVAEVIQKRLLTKNENGIEQLSEVYHVQVNNFKTLFDFADGSRTYRNYKDRDHFIYSYPFIPYQYTLFQDAIQNLSQHNAFEGKHSSVGERSMLGVFQQVAIQIAENNIGQLATFDLMFEGIRTALKSQIQQSIITAEKQLDNKFAIKVLKSLFLVKYVRDFKATLRNICVLMTNEFNRDLPTLRKEVDEALNLLEQQTYIQRNGEFYEYLTDEEKDVEQEIKGVEIDMSSMIEELGKIIFDTMVRDTKIRYDINNQDYPFSRKLDDKLLGREYELTVNVISPFHEYAGDIMTLRAQSTGKAELLIIMPPSDRLVRDVGMYLKTEKYIRQNMMVSQQESIKRILQDKAGQNSERQKEMQTLIRSLMKEAKLLIMGDILEVTSEDPRTIVNKGGVELITRVYPSLKMLKGITYSENNIPGLIRGEEGSLFKDGNVAFSEAEQEMLAFINMNKSQGLRTTINNLLEKFERKPYGWYRAAVLCILAKLCSRGKVEVRHDGNILEDNDLEKALLNSRDYSAIMLEPLMEFTQSQIRQLKEFCSEFFDAPVKSDIDAKALGKETEIRFAKKKNELLVMASQIAPYPFKDILKTPIECMQELTGKASSYYLANLNNFKDTLMDTKERVIEPVGQFVNGHLKILYDEVAQFMEQQKHNFSYLDSEDYKQVLTLINDKHCYKSVNIQQAKALKETLKSKLETTISEEKQLAGAALEELKTRILGMPEYQQLSSEQKMQVSCIFDSAMDEVIRQTLIAAIKELPNRFEDGEYKRLLVKIDGWVAPPAQPLPLTTASQPEIRGSVPSQSMTTPPIVKPEYISSKNLKVNYKKPFLSSEQDVEEYLAAYKATIMKEIKEGKRIQI